MDRTLYINHNHRGPQIRRKIKHHRSLTSLSYAVFLFHYFQVDLGLLSQNFIHYSYHLDNFG